MDSSAHGIFLSVKSHTRESAPRLATPAKNETANSAFPEKNSFACPFKYLNALAGKERGRDRARNKIGVRLAIPLNNNIPGLTISFCISYFPLFD